MTLDEDNPQCCGEPMKDDFRLDNVFWIHIPCWYCHKCGKYIDKPGCW